MSDRADATPAPDPRPTRYFFDTEFIEDGTTIDLISIGIVCEDGREYYAESDAADWSKASQWVLDNVRPHLVGSVKSRAVIAADILKFANEGTSRPEWWAYYADYDWIALCQLYGTMMDLPKSWPMFCMDIKQAAVMVGNPTLPEQDGVEHHALADARWNRVAFDALGAAGLQVVPDSNLLALAAAQAAEIVDLHATQEALIRELHELKSAWFAEKTEAERLRGVVPAAEIDQMRTEADEDERLIRRRGAEIIRLRSERDEVVRLRVDTVNREWEHVYGEQTRLVEALEAELGRLRGVTADRAEDVIAAAEDLLKLKDGPRDLAYRARKEPSWERLRAAVRVYRRVSP